MDEFSFNFKVLSFLGLIIRNDTKLSKKRKAFHVILIFIFVSSFYSSSFAYFTSPHSILHKTLAVSLIIGCTEALFKLVFMFVYKSEINELVNLIEDPLDSGFDEMNELDKLMRKNSAKHIQNFNFVIFLYSNCFAFFGQILPRMLKILTATLICKSESMLTSNCYPAFILTTWWPFEYDNISVYVFRTLYQLVGTLMWTFVNTSTDAFVCSLILAASKRSKLLAHLAPDYLLPGPGNTVTPHFIAWVQYHQHYISIIKEMNRVFGPLILSVHLASVAMIIVCTFFVIEQNSSSNFIIAIFCTTLFLVHIFMYAKAGQEILQNTAALRDAVLEVTHTPGVLVEVGPARSALQVILTRVKGEHVTSDQINGMELFSLKMSTFNRVCSTSFSYLAILLRQRPKV